MMHRKFQKNLVEMQEIINSFENFKAKEDQHKTIFQRGLNLVDQCLKMLESGEGKVEEVYLKDKKVMTKNWNF